MENKRLPKPKNIPPPPPLTEEGKEWRNHASEIRADFEAKEEANKKSLNGAIIVCFILLVLLFFLTK
jgi:hypothetical protein